MTPAKFYVSMLAASLASGVIGGVTVHLVSRPKTSAKPGVSASAEPSSDLANRIDGLERSVAGLERERRIRSLVTPSDDNDPSTPDAGARRAVIDDPVFDTAVRDVIEQVETERTNERQLRGQERRKQNIERFTNDLGQELGLNDAQKAKVLEVVQSYFDELRAMRETDGGGPLPRSEWRQKARDLRDKSEAKLGQILSASQMDKYKELDDDKRLGAGGGRRGGRGND
jgi:hypothetical protein